MGALLPDGVRRGAVAHALGGGARARAGRRRLPRDRHACASRRATACGRPTSRPTRRRTRRAWASASATTRTFLGAATRCASASRAKRLCCLVLEDPRSVALGNEPVRVGGEVVGRVTTGGFGYTVERSIAYAYLPPEHAAPGTAVEIDVFGTRVGGEVVAEPLYDPGGERLRGDGSIAGGKAPAEVPPTALARPGHVEPPLPAHRSCRSLQRRRGAR